MPFLPRAKNRLTRKKRSCSVIRVFFLIAPKTVDTKIPILINSSCLCSPLTAIHAQMALEAAQQNLSAMLRRTDRGMRILFRNKAFRLRNADASRGCRRQHFPLARVRIPPRGLFALWKFQRDSYKVKKKGCYSSLFNVLTFSFSAEAYDFISGFIAFLHFRGCKYRSFAVIALKIILCNRAFDPYPVFFF